MYGSKLNCIRPAVLAAVLTLAGATACSSALATPSSFVIEVQSGGPGTVSPSGNVIVPAGGSQEFIFTPNNCYVTGDVGVDDASVGTGILSYTFTNVQADHVLYVPFILQSSSTSLSVSPTPALCGRPDTLVAQVVHGEGGQVQFFNGAALLGTRAVTGGIATLVLKPGLANGSHALSAHFLGTACAEPSESPALNYVVPDGSAETFAVTFEATPQYSILANQPVSLNVKGWVGGDIATWMTGTVDFYDGATLFSSATLGAGQVQANRSFGIGVHVLTARLTPSNCFAPVVSAPETVEVRANNAGGNSVLTLTAAPNGAPLGSTTVLTATDNRPAATGLVRFINVTTATEIGTASMVDGVATLNYGPLDAGDRTLQAHYDGDLFFFPVNSAQILLHVGEVASTSLSMSPQYKYTYQYQPMPITLQVSPPGATTTATISAPGGLFPGPHTLSVNNGIATYSSELQAPLGPLYFYGHVPGNPYYYASDDTLVVYLFAPSPTAALTVEGPAHPKFGDPVTFRATVNSPSPSGSVNFYVDNSDMGSVSVAGGVATFTTSALSPGPHTALASWSGESWRASNRVSVFVTGTSPTQTALAVPMPPIVRSGDPFSMTATVTPTSASGVVEFTNSVNHSYNAPLGSGVAMWNSSYPAAGFYTYRATYAGDLGDATSTDSVLVEVNGTAPEPLVLSDVNPSAIGQLVTFTAQFATPVPGSTMKFYIDGALVDSTVLATGFYSYSTNALTAGTHIAEGKCSGSLLQASNRYAQAVGVAALPRLQVVSPNGSETFVVGTTAQIRWNPYSAIAVPNVSLYVARSGINWELIASNVPNTGSFDWAVTGPGVNGAQSSNRTASIAVIDPSGSIGSDASDSPFWLVSPGTLGAATSAPLEFTLGPGSPNPSAGAVSIAFTVAHAARVKLSIIDLQGREVAVLADGERAAGSYRARWDGRDGHGTTAAGVYFVRYETPAKTINGRVAVIR